MKTLEITQTPAVLDFNYKAVKASIEQELEQYRITVTEDTVADAKKLATDLNKRKSELDTRRKEAVRAVSAPIKDADDKMKGLVKLMEDGRQLIIEQVRKFEQETLDDLQAKLMQVMADCREANGIQPEFRTQSYADLVILSNRTKTGNVAGKAVKEIEARIAQEKALQDRTERRILELENHCYRSGLDAPLQRQHVESFLFADDEEYGEKLERMMQAELDRQIQASERRQRMEEQRRPEPQPEPETDEQCGAGRENQEGEAEVPRTVDELMAGSQQPKQPNRVLPAGKVPCTVTATFEINVHPDTPHDKIREHLRKNLEKAGITTLADVKVEMHG